MSELKPTGAETGNLYPFMEALAKESDFSLSFLTRKYNSVKNLEDSKGEILYASSLQARKCGFSIRKL